MVLLIDGVFVNMTMVKNINRLEHIKTEADPLFTSINHNDIGQMHLNILYGNLWANVLQMSHQITNPFLSLQLKKNFCRLNFQ